MERAHVAIGNIHFAHDLTMCQVESMGIYCPSMRKDICAMVRVCGCQKDKGNFDSNALALYHINTITPQWAKSIVEFLTTKTFPKKIGKLWQRYLQR